MTTRQYLSALENLGLSPFGRATQAALGLSVRQCARLASGDQDVTATVALLIAAYLRHGLPQE